MFSVLFSGLCACWPAESLEQPQADGSQEASGSSWPTATPGWESRDCAHHIHRCPQLPPTYVGTEIIAQNNENLKGEKRGREWRACSYFLIIKLLTFNSLTLENPFVNSKTWYKTEDSRLLLGLPTFFSCHLSQDRISPLEAAV